MSDLIERAEAIKALYKYSFVSKDVIEREIKAIPSVPTIKTKQIKYYDDDEKVWKTGEVIVNTLHDITDSYKGSEYNGNIKDQQQSQRCKR